MNRISVFLLLILLLGAKHCFSNNQNELSILTCSKGNESFTLWGHSAIRHVNEEKSIDVVYNFGLFDFNTPNFYYKFIKGKLKYQLGIHSSDRFFRSYNVENRQIIEQRLNLSDEIKIKIVNELEYLHKPENRYYYYNFLNKNCTSKLRDLLFVHLKTDLKKKLTSQTYRELICGSLIDEYWLKFGVNLILGANVDKKITVYERMFLPDYLRNELNDLYTNKEKIVEFERKYGNDSKVISNTPAFYLFSPVVVFFLLLILICFKRFEKLQALLYLLIGFTGLVILFITIFSEHQEVRDNFNLLWCSPLYLIFTTHFFRKEHRFQFILLMFLQMQLLALVILWLANVQKGELSFYLIVLVLSVSNIKMIKNNNYISELLKFTFQK